MNLSFAENCFEGKCELWREHVVRFAFSLLTRAMSLLIFEASASAFAVGLMGRSIFLSIGRLHPMLIILQRWNQTLGVGPRVRNWVSLKSSHIGGGGWGEGNVFLGAFSALHGSSRDGLRVRQAEHCGQSIWRHGASAFPFREVL